MALATKKQIDFIKCLCTKTGRKLPIGYPDLDKVTAARIIDNLIRQDKSKNLNQIPDEYKWEYGEHNKFVHSIAKLLGKHKELDIPPFLTIAKIGVACGGKRQEVKITKIKIEPLGIRVFAMTGENFTAMREIDTISLIKPARAELLEQIQKVVVE